jgi:poly(A) polymerase
MPTTPIAIKIIKQLVARGHVAYIAGGWVRDFLMNHPSDDIDIATSATVEEIQSIFPKTIPVGIAFGIVIVVEEGHQFEVATFRTEQGYVDGRRPTQITHATACEDALRRDFTINGMFYDPIERKLHDYVGGKADLDKGVIRAIGNPHERFLEDRLRMMRAVRYSTRFNFPIEKATVEAIVAHAHSLLPAVAHERIWQEFQKMSRFDHFDKGLITLHQIDLLPTIFPALKGIRIEEIERRVSCIDRFPKQAPTIAELLTLFQDDSITFQLQICEYLKLSKQDKEFVRFLAEMKATCFLPKTEIDLIEPIKWAHLYAHPSISTALHIIAAYLTQTDTKEFLDYHAKKQTALKTAIYRIQNQSPLITASDLIKIGVQPGVRMGLLLKEAERIGVNEGIEEKKHLLDKLKIHPIFTNQGK